MKMISWNVNGIRACKKSGFEESMKALEADFIGLQEVKCQEDTLPELSLDMPYSYFNYAQKRGYSGTAIFTRHEPQRAVYDIPNHENDEGRVIALHYDKFIFVNAYVPNSGDGLRRLEYRTTAWESAMTAYLGELAREKPVIYCGDLNVAHTEMDLANPDRNHRSAGFTDEERAALDALLESGFKDTFRELYPEQRDAYSWWSYRTRARERNAGWRIDYFLITPNLLPQLKDASIYTDIYGSDHCPVGILLDLS